MEKYLYGYDSMDNAYLVSDYPWGFRLRTEIRYWIEDKEGFGQRVCHQTKNPKTGLWCAPKKSTYYNVLFMGLDENGYVKNTALTFYNSEEEVKTMLEKHKANINDFQAKAFKLMLAHHEVCKNVTCTVTCGVKRTEEEQLKYDKEQREIEVKISNAIYAKANSINL